MKEKNEKKEETTFANAYLHHLLIHQNTIETNRAYKTNDLHGWFQGLVVAYKLIIFKLSDIESKSIFDKIEQVRQDIKKNDRESATITLHLIEIEEIKMRHKYELIFPKFAYSSGIDKLTQRYSDLAGVLDD